MEIAGSPQIFLIAGPNGAGKSTFAAKFLPRYAQSREFVNADSTAAGLSPFAPELQSMRAGRLALARIKELAEARSDFGFETTLPGRGYLNMIARLKRTGYHVTLFFLWLPDAEIAIARVADRVRLGGHDIPEPIIRRRFDAGLRNFLRLYSAQADFWRLYDGSRTPPLIVAESSGGPVQAHRPETLRAIRERWGD